MNETQLTQVQSVNQNLKKKQSLILTYFNQISKLEKERSQINSKIKNLKTKFHELILVEENPDQLCLFENIDDFLEE